ncbi:MAG: nucleotidyltransferase domain-containing protein [Treponema sp.]|nr:nucleotidyltransferase domain-containing protein [Treponema sp.]
MIINEEIEKIKEIIINTIPLERLYLFGSYAYGTPGEDSDYDFYAVVPDNSIRPLEAIQKIYGATDMKRKPIDVLAGTTEIFERRSKLLTMEKTISEKGLVLYDRQQ